MIKAIDVFVTIQKISQSIEFCLSFIYIFFVWGWGYFFFLNHFIVGTRNAYIFNNRKSNGVHTGKHTDNIPGETYVVWVAYPIL